MVDEKDLAKLKKISQSLTEAELKPAREIFASISATNPNGFIPLLFMASKKDDQNEFKYEYQLSQTVVELMLSLREKYPEGEVALAICYKLLGEVRV